MVKKTCQKQQGTNHVFKDEKQLMIFHRHLLQLHNVRVNQFLKSLQKDSSFLRKQSCKTVSSEYVCDFIQLDKTECTFTSRRLTHSSHWKNFLFIFLTATWMEQREQVSWCKYCRCQLTFIITALSVKQTKGYNMLLLKLNQ